MKQSIRTKIKDLYAQFRAFLREPEAELIGKTIAVVLALLLLWGIFGRVNVTVSTAAVVTSGTAVCYVKEQDISLIEVGMPVNMSGYRYMAEVIDPQPFLLTPEEDEYTYIIGDLKPGERVYQVSFRTMTLDGVYSAVFIVDRVSPLRYLFL